MCEVFSAICPVRSVSHIVADFMVSGNKSGQVSLRFHVGWQVLSFWLVFVSEGSLRSTERPHVPSVLQACTPDVPWRPAVDDVQTCFIVVNG